MWAVDAIRKNISLGAGNSYRPAIEPFVPSSLHPLRPSGFPIRKPPGVQFGRGFFVTIAEKEYEMQVLRVDTVQEYRSDKKKHFLSANEW